MQKQESNQSAPPAPERLTPEQWDRVVEGAKQAITLNQAQCPPPVPRTAEEEAMLRLD